MEEYDYFTAEIDQEILNEMAELITHYTTTIIQGAPKQTRKNARVNQLSIGQRGKKRKARNISEEKDMVK
eukprot:gene2265-2602_t